MTHTAAFALMNGWAICGGFTGTEAQRSRCDRQTCCTILSGDIEQNDITDGGMLTTTANIKCTNAYHLVKNRP
ncbi:MAG: hypothetical protein WHX52_12635 [Anaerolineae bacterium]